MSGERLYGQGDLDPTLTTASTTMIGRTNLPDTFDEADERATRDLENSFYTAGSESANEIAVQTEFEEALERANPTRKMRLYLAGPMRGYAESNFPAFLAKAEELRTAGYEVFSPAEADIDNGFDYKNEAALETFNLRAALGDDLEYVSQTADGVALLPGWEASRGALAEVATALALDLPVALASDWLLDDHLRDFVTELPVKLSKPPAYTPGIGIGWIQPYDESFTTNDEVRVTSETGGQKGTKLAQVGSMDVMPLLELGKVAGFGAQKYAAYNYLKGYDWSLSWNAMERHMIAFWNGEDNDPESGLPHMAHAMWHASAMLSFSIRGLGTDDRYKG